MSGNPTVVLMTTEEMLALPENGMDRELIRGELREKPMTVRNQDHSRIEANVVYWLKDWLRKQTPPRGAVYCGEVGCRLRRNPDTTVGIDVVYAGPELSAHRSPDTTLIDGVPVLAVEILSPSSTEEEINEKLQEYLDAGVASVWIIDPFLQTVQVVRPGVGPELFNIHQEVSGEPYLPGFRLVVTEVFAD
jgi:Uma2 family endonuclease